MANLFPLQKTLVHDYMTKEKDRERERERKNARIYIDIEKGTEKNHNIVHTTIRMYTPPIGGKKMVEKKK